MRNNDMFLAALKRSAKQSADGFIGVGKVCGVDSQQMINRFNDVLKHETIDDMYMILSATNDTSALEILCEDFGGRFVTRNQYAHDCISSALLHASKEHGDLHRVYEQSMRDGKLDDDERLQLLREIAEAQAALVELRNTVVKTGDSDA